MAPCMAAGWGVKTRGGSNRGPTGPEGGGAAGQAVRGAEGKQAVGGGGGAGERVLRGYAAKSKSAQLKRRTAN